MARVTDKISFNCCLLKINHVNFILYKFLLLPRSGYVFKAKTSSNLNITTTNVIGQFYLE